MITQDEFDSKVMLKRLRKVYNNLCLYINVNKTDLNNGFMSQETERFQYFLKGCDKKDRNKYQN